MSVKNYVYNESSPLDGVFKYFTNYLHDLFLVEASTTQTERGSISNIIDQTIISNSNQNTWLSEAIENSSFTITFLYFPFKLESYSIKSRGDWDYNYPAEWIIEGSNDNATWTLLHYHERNDELSQKRNHICHWNASNTDVGFFRHFKMTQLGRNCKTEDYGYEYYFSMNKIEFFGEKKITTYSWEIKRQ